MWEISVKGEIMQKTTKLILSAGILLVTLFIAGANSTENNQANAQAEYPKVMVQAFLAEVKLEALYKQNVNPLGQKPKSVTVENILDCLKDKDKAKIVTGLKTVQQADGAEYKSQTEKTCYIKHEEQKSVPNGEQQVVSRRLDPYKQGTSLNSAVSMMPEDKIKVEFSFSHSGFSLDKENKDIPPDQLSFDWRGCVLVKAGKPAIAAATQDEEKAVFLIITADVQAD
jgi:hypothetical protein